MTTKKDVRDKENENKLRLAQLSAKYFERELDHLVEIYEQVKALKPGEGKYPLDYFKQKTFMANAKMAQWRLIRHMAETAVGKDKDASTEATRQLAETLIKSVREGFAAQGIKVGAGRDQSKAKRLKDEAMKVGDVERGTPDEEDLKAKDGG